jgi:hypothetical protein
MSFSAPRCETLQELAQPLLWELIQRKGATHSDTLGHRGLATAGSGTRRFAARSVAEHMTMARRQTICSRGEYQRHADTTGAVPPRHLRDIALRRMRQIFFATADTKLAGLFVRKFRFLEISLGTSSWSGSHEYRARLVVWERSRLAASPSKRSANQELDLRGPDEPVANSVPKHPATRFALCYQRFAAQGDLRSRTFRAT